MKMHPFVKIIYFQLLLSMALPWTCICATASEQSKDASGDTKADFSFLENDKKHEDWIDPFNMFEYKPSGGYHKTADSVADHSDESYEKDKIISEQSANLKTARGDDIDHSSEKYEHESGKNLLNSFAPQQKADVCCKTEKNSCKDEEFIYLKRSANMILNKVEALKHDSSSNIMDVALTITEDDIATLKAFLHSPCKHVQEFDSIIVATLNNAKLMESHNFLDSVYNNVHQVLQLEFVIYYIATSIAVIASFNLLFRLSMRKIISRLIIITFFLSFAWNWTLLLKTETADSHAKAEALGPNDCHFENIGTYKKITLILGSIFFQSGDKCKQYYEVMLIEPVWKVSPLKALSKTFSELCFHPLGLLGQHVGYFFQNLFSSVSWYLLLPVSVIVTIIILFLLLMVFGYRIRLPFFFTIEPGHQHYTKEQQQLITDMLEGKVHIQRASSHTAGVSEMLEHCSSCKVTSNPQKALEQIKSTSKKNDKATQINVSGLSSLDLCCYLTDGKINGKIQDLEPVTKNNSIDNMHDEE